VRCWPNRVKGTEYVSFGTARRLLECSEGRLNLYIAQGRLKTEKYGKREYIELESLQNLVVELRAKQGQRRQV
jgi:hypothetical protein